MAQVAAAFGEPMPYEDYLDLPDELRAEYVDGRALVSPPPSVDHQRICLRLARVLDDVVEAPAEVILAAGWHLPHGRSLRIPDVMVVRDRVDGPLVTQPPLLVIEVLSSNRRDDLVRKSTAYLEAGLDQYWIVDPRDRAMDIFARRSSGWEPVVSLDDRHPQGTVTLPGGGSLDLDLGELLDG